MSDKKYYLRNLESGDLEEVTKEQYEGSMGRRRRMLKGVKGTISVTSTASSGEEGGDLREIFDNPENYKYGPGPK